jgi:hypothetical protein
MPDEAEVYCATCGSACTAIYRYCERCGAALTPDRRGRLAGTAFLLNEAQNPPLRDIIPQHERDRLIAHYRRALTALAGSLHEPGPLPAAPAAAPATPVAAAAAPGAGPERNISAAAADPGAWNLSVRLPKDWSWLAEQQANLFLFAGAFLVVIAALIYVGYSKQAVGGALKMSLLVAYTAAFLAAGVLCLRAPRVEVAGRVFLAVGAIFVPLNFVAAYNIFSDQDLSAEAMWLSGSLTSAALYTCVAAVGLGRGYSFASGGALASAVAAAIVLAGLPVEWAAATFLALAFAMALAEIAAPEPFRTRVGSTWMLLAHGIAAVSLAFATIAAAVVLGYGEETDISTRWFLAPAFALSLAFYLLEGLLRRQRVAVIGSGLSLAGLGASLVFGADMNAEYYAYSLIAAGGAIFAFARWGAALLPEWWVRPDLRQDSAWLGQLAIVTGVSVAIIAAITAAGPETEYVPETPWFLFAAFAASGASYAIYLTMPLPVLGESARTATYGFGLSIAGMTTAAVYATEISAEYYSFAFAAAAFPLLALAAWGLPRRIAAGPAYMREDALLLAHISAAAAALVAVGAVLSAAAEEATYRPDSLWFLPALFALLAAFYSLAIASRFTPTKEAGIAAAGGLIASVFGTSTGLVYALDVSTEYYAFAFLLPAIGLGFLALWPTMRSSDHLLPADWRIGAIWCGRIAVVTGLSIAVAAALVAADQDTTYEPDTRSFLPLAFATAAAFLAFDASGEKRWETSAAFLAALTAIAVAVAYSAGADVEYYGIAFSGAGLALGFGGRIWSPPWLDLRARDYVAALAVTLGWLPFEFVYADSPGIGAGTHFAAALLYASDAALERSEMTLDRLFDLPDLVPVRLAVGWLYAAGLAAAVGYIHVLNGLSGAEEAEAASLALPLMPFGLAFIVAGALLRRWRPDFRIHLYLMALLLSIASISLADNSGTSAVLLSVFAAAYLALAAWEDAPALAAPSAIFGFAAVAAWRHYGDAPLAVVPVAYSAIGVATYAAGLAARSRWRRWSMALRGGGALYALVAPAAGFGIITSTTERGLIDGEPFETSALYQWSTLVTAVVGGLAVVEYSLTRRGWLLAAGSSVLLVAVLLQIGRFQPQNIQAYSAVIGVYLVFFGLLGLSRLRLIPELTDTAQYVESLGAATVMLPSFIQSFEGGWEYQLILLLEAVLFLTVSVALRRRGILGVSLLALVLVGGRSLFDALNALPNWIVALVAGMALLGVGMGILLGRERWSKWQETALSWWADASGGGEAPAN